MSRVEAIEPIGIMPEVSVVRDVDADVGSETLRAAKARSCRNPHVSWITPERAMCALRIYAVRMINELRRAI